MIDVNKIKKHIIDLAIQGKLTEQYPDKEDAGLLLSQIRSEKEELIRKGILRKEKALGPINQDDIAFDLPKNWRWVRLGDFSQKVTDQVASGSFQALRENVVSLKEPSYALMVKTADFANGFTKNLTYTDKRGYEFLSNSNLFGGELILSNIGSIGKVFIVPKMDIRMTLAPNSVMIRVFNKESIMYLYYYLLSNQGFKELDDISTGSTMKKINKGDLKTILLAIPPLEEQIRIVERLNEIFFELEKIQKAQDDLQVLRSGLENKTIELALKGKLVEQLSEDGDSDSYFDIIQIERKRLIKDGKAKNYVESEIDLSEVPFDIPSSWKWVYLGSLFNHNAGKALNNSDREGTVLEYITTSNVYADHFELDHLKKMPFKDSEIEKCTIHKGDLLVLEGGDIGRAAIWNEDYDMRIQNHIHKLRPFYDIETKFFYYLLNYYKNNELINGNGIGLQGLSSNKLHFLIVPLPPLNEQKRIVKRIEEVLNLCKTVA